MTERLEENRVWSFSRADAVHLVLLNPFTPELKKCILPTFQKAIV